MKVSAIAPGMQSEFAHHAHFPLDKYGVCQHPRRLTPANVIESVLAINYHFLLVFGK
jgi:hypothetical protein